MTTAHEESYLEGRRSAMRELLGRLAEEGHAAGLDTTKEQALVERSQTDSVLRALHRDMGGDGRWPENLHLADVVEKYIRRRQDWTRSALFTELHQQIEEIVGRETICPDTNGTAQRILCLLAEVLGPTGRYTSRTWLNAQKGPYRHPREQYPESEQVRVRVGPLTGVVVGEFIAYKSEGEEDPLDPRWGWPLVRFDLIYGQNTPHPALFSHQRAMTALHRQPRHPEGSLNPLVMPCDPESVEVVEP